MTEVLRDEWGFRGAVITDAYASGRNDPDECIRAGVDALLSWNMSSVNATDWEDRTSATALTAMQNACKNMLYCYIDCRYTALMADSLSLNNLIGSNPDVFAWWKVVLTAFDITVGVGLAVWCTLITVFSVKKMKKLRLADEPPATTAAASE